MFRAAFRPPERSIWPGRKSVWRNAVLLSLLFACIVAAQSPAGYILKLQGSWTVNGRPLAAGNVVRAGDKIEAKGPTDAIGMVFYDGTYLKCELGKPHPPNCSNKIDIKADTASKGIWSAFFERLQNKSLPPVAFVTSRGVGPPPPVQLRDAVLAHRGLIVDFADAISAPPPSDLRLLLEPLELPASCAAIDVKLTAKATTAGVPDLKPACMGLYQVSSPDESMEAASPATVLFVPAAQLDRASKLLAEVTDRASQWQNATDAEKHTFIRISLSAIRQMLRAPK